MRRIDPLKDGRLLTKEKGLSVVVGSTRLERSEFTTGHCHNPSEQTYLEEDRIVATSISSDL